MKKTIGPSHTTMVRMALIAIAVLALPLVAHAQTGCTDSPENPTLLLGLVGGGGALLSSARRRWKSRRERAGMPPESRSL